RGGRGAADAGPPRARGRARAARRRADPARRGDDAGLRRRRAAGGAGRAVRRVARIAAVYTLLTIVCTWPLAAHLRTHLPASPPPTTLADSLLLGWVLSWDVHQLLHDPCRLFEANIFHPLRHTLA